MTLPKEWEERAMSVAEVDRKREHDRDPDRGAARPTAASWRMPGGEDLLRFALSAGLATGVWWLEHREEEAAGGLAPSPAGGTASKEPR
jgi:hypothetical protein